MRKPAWFDPTLAGELFCLLLAAPALYFPNWFPAWAPALALALLGGGWLWRRWRLGLWLVRTPADWPLFFLFGVMLPIALWAAPDPLREQYSNPRALILVWNFCLFYTVATHASLRPTALRNLTWLLIVVAGVVALLAPLGINWLDKFSPLMPFLNRIPTVLRGVFAGAENGFSGNQVAGALLYVLPLLYAFTLFAPAGQRLRRPAWWLLALLALYMTGVLVLTQSRGGLIGFGVGMLVMLLLPSRWGRWGLAVTTCLAIVMAPFWYDPMLNVLGGLNTAVADAGIETTVMDATNLVGRQEVWLRAIFGIEDFIFTGMGLGTFRAVMPAMYPMFSAGPDFDIAHAHNFFLQTALDFGLPGLSALLALYMVAVVQIVRVWRAPSIPGALPLQSAWRTWASGLAGCLAAQTVYSQFDAVAMGSKPNFFLWVLLALIYGSANLALSPQRAATIDVAVPAVVFATQPVAEPGRTAPARQRRRVAGRIAAGVATLVFALLLLPGVRLGVTTWQTVQTAQALQTQVAALATEPGTLATVQTTLARLSGELGDLEGQLRPLAPFLRRLAPLGGYGVLAANVPELAALGRRSADLAAAAVAPLAPAPAATTPAALLAQMGPHLPALAPELDDLALQLEQLPSARMAAPYGALLQQGASLLTLAQVGALLGPELPWLLGMDASRRYLVLVQNNHELRATGGFISAVGLVTVDQGTVTAVDFADSYAFYRDGGVYPLAPDAMREHMGIELVLLRDANWSPHFPTTAQLARQLYADQTGAVVDGVVSVDIHAVKHFIGALDALQTPGSAVPLTQENVEAQIVQFWDAPLTGADQPLDAQTDPAAWLAARKDFIPQLAQAILARIQQGDVNGAALAAALQDALADRSIQVWLDNQPAAATLAAAGWNGGLHPSASGDADFLAVVDANLGYNKVNALIERGHDYQVTWPDGPGQPALATLTLAYQHPVAAGQDPGCDPTPRYGEAYVAMMARCYFDYVRVYAPAGSQLIDVDGVAPFDVTAQVGEQGTTEFATFFVLPPGESQRLVFTYRLPVAIQPEHYRLVVQRQAGAGPLPLTLVVDGVAGNLVVEDGAVECAKATPGFCEKPGVVDD